MIYDEKMLGTDNKSDGCVMHTVYNESVAEQLKPLL